MAGQNKEVGTSSKDTGKESGRENGQGGKEKKNKDEVARRLSELAGELSELRQAMAAIAAGPSHTSPRHAATAATTEFSTPDGSFALTDADDALIARLGYALSSAPKVALARLLYTGGEQSAAQLGEQAGLTTGSLYHHLRELMHAELVIQQTRTRYHLTERGRRALDALTPLARE